MLRPHIAFASDDQLLFLLRKTFWNRFKRIDFFQVYGTQVVIEIRVRGGRHDGPMPGTDGLHSSFHTPPRLYNGPFGQSSFKDLIPANELSAVLPQEAFDPPNEVGLKLMFIGQSFGHDPPLAFGACFPSGLWRFVSANVY